MNFTMDIVGAIYGGGVLLSIGCWALHKRGVVGTSQATNSKTANNVLFKVGKADNNQPKTESQQIEDRDESDDVFKRRLSGTDFSV